MKILPISRSHLSKRQRSKHSENQLARQYNGRVQPASGALPVAALKGDVVTDIFLFDDKTTGAKSFSVNEETFLKLARDAFRMRRIPAMRVRFESSNRAYYVIDGTTFTRLVDFLEEEGLGD